MIKLAVKDSNWIECHEWECKQRRFIDFPQVCEKFLNNLKTKLMNIVVVIMKNPNFHKKIIIIIIIVMTMTMV